MAPEPTTTPPASVHVMVMGVTPPDTFAVAVPLHAWHWLGVTTVAMESGAGSLIVKVNVVSQPDASEICTVQAPAHRPRACGVPCPLGGTGDQTKEYVPVPPDGASVMSASHDPPQLTGATVAFANSGCGPPNSRYSLLQSGENTNTLDQGCVLKVSAKGTRTRLLPLR